MTDSKILQNIFLAKMKLDIYVVIWIAIRHLCNDHPLQKKTFSLENSSIKLPVKKVIFSVWKEMFLKADIFWKESADRHCCEIHLKTFFRWKSTWNNCFISFEKIKIILWILNIWTILNIFEYFLRNVLTRKNNLFSFFLLHRLASSRSDPWSKVKTWRSQTCQTWRANLKKTLLR